MTYVCEYEYWTTGPDGLSDYSVYFCTLPDGHEGPHDARTTCGFTPAEMGADAKEVNGS